MAAISASTARSHRGARTTDASHSVARTTTATCWPDTATRWLRPATRIASLRSAGSRPVSPIAAPGTSPRASDGNASVTSRSPARSRATAAPTGDGGATRSTRVALSAAERRPASGASLPTARTRDPAG